MNNGREAKQLLAFKNYLPRYEKLVIDTLMSASTISELIPTFNTNFPSHQPNEKWKTHPDSLRDGKVTCDMAAVLASYWWLLTKQLDSFFAVQNCSRADFEPHCSFGLPIRSNKQAPLTSYLDQRQQSQEDLLPSIDTLEVAWLHWLVNGGLQPIGKKNGKLQVPANVLVFVEPPSRLAKSRIKAHKLPHTHQIVNSALATTL